MEIKSLLAWTHLAEEQQEFSNYKLHVVTELAPLCFSSLTEKNEHVMRKMCLFQKYFQSRKLNVNHKTLAKQTNTLMAGISCTIFLKSGLYYPKFPWQFNFCARGTGESLSLWGRQLSLEASPPSIVMPFLCSALFAVVSWGNRYIYYAAKGNQQSNRMTIPGPLTTSLLQEKYQFSFCSINCGQFNRKKNGLYT